MVAHPIGGVFSVALSFGYPKFPLRTTVPCGVRTFLTGLKPERPCVRPETYYLRCFFINTLIRQLISPLILLPRHMSNRPALYPGKQILYLKKEGL